MFEFNQTRLKIKEKLGKGRFGTVFPYQKHSEDLKWAAKRIKAEDSDALVASLPEVILGMSCDHLNIVPIKGYFIEKNDDNEGYNIYTKLPRMKGTLLEDFKERKVSGIPYSEEEIIRHFYSLVCGVEYLHSKKIFHGDLKPESLLLDKDNILKIADVGISKHIIEEKRLVNFQYSAPEALGVEAKKEMLKKADIWSLGVVVLELFCFDLKLLNASLSKDQLQNRLNELFKSLQGKYQNGVIGLLRRILSLDPKERPEIGLIRGELEKNFPQILNEKAKNQQIGISDEQKQEMFGKYEAEIKHLKGLISQFESELARKGEMQSHAKTSIQRNTFEKDDEERKVNNNFDEQIQKFEEEKLRISKEYDQLLIQECTENLKLQHKIRFLEVKIEELQNKPKVERPKRESDEGNYQENLQLVVSKLNSKWHKWYKSESFECKVDSKFLQITSPKKSATDKSLSKFSRDLMQALEDYSIVNLHGITFSCSTPQLTDKSMSDFAFMLSNESLKLQHIVISLVDCQGVTDKSFEDLAKALNIHCNHLKHLSLMFNDCSGLTDKSLGFLAKTLSNDSLRLNFLELSFERVRWMTNIGFDNITKAIEGRDNQSRSLQFLKLMFPDTKVTPEKKEQTKWRFDKIAYLDIK